MNPESELDQIRREFEARQRNLLPGDNHRLPIPAVFSPWNQDSGKRSLIPAVFFLLLAIGIVAIPFMRDFQDGTIVAFIIALGPLFMFCLLIRDFVLHLGDRSQDRNK